MSKSSSDVQVHRRTNSDFRYFHGRSFFLCSISKDLYPRAEISSTSEQIENELNESRFALHELLLMLEHQTVNQHYERVVKGLCEGALFGLTLMTVAGLTTGFLLTLLVCVDAHTWIYLNQK